MTLSIRASLSTQNIDGELVILDKDNGQIHQLNSVASFIWQRLEKQNGVEAIINQLIEAFDVDEATAKTDVDKAIQQFKSLNLINEF